VTVQLLRPRPDHLDPVEVEGLHGLLQEGGATQQRLDQGDVQVRPAHREHEAGQPGAGADVADVGPLREHVRQHGAVEQVSFPEPGGLPRADQTAHHPGVGEQGRVPLGEREPSSEHPLRQRGRRGCFT